jgi:hypothetical protein
MQKRLLRRGIRIMWCKEFQTMRGVHGFGVAPHMHFMMTKPLFAHDLARMWYEIVGSGDFRHYQAGTHIDWIRNPNNYGTYFAKYMTKTDQKEVPDDFINCGRMWGISRGLLQIVQYMFKTQKAGSVRFLRMFRKWNAAQIRAWYGHRWKRKRGSGGFTAWNGRNFIEAYRGKMQTTTLMS